MADQALITTTLLNIEMEWDVFMFKCLLTLLKRTYDPVRSRHRQNRKSVATMCAREILESEVRTADNHIHDRWMIDFSDKIAKWYGDDFDLVETFCSDTIFYCCLRLLFVSETHKMVFRVLTGPACMFKTSLLKNKLKEGVPVVVGDYNDHYDKFPIFKSKSIY
ncbi:uncharacterized protein LOC113470839 [Diaphorina citri]|uniref:Uncharacterized protein LOC113470839 n=1 Tax=Diaphorina citri TaxID=121845 RepID=A0A3Q0JFA9_DIACI|nr:uncharacterized protein LOC113470839 [Diaphorina citri]